MSCICWIFPMSIIRADRQLVCKRFIMRSWSYIVFIKLIPKSTWALLSLIKRLANSPSSVQKSYYKPRQNIFSGNCADWSLYAASVSSLHHDTCKLGGEHFELSLLISLLEMTWGLLLVSFHGGWPTAPATKPLSCKPNATVLIVTLNCYTLVLWKGGWGNPETLYISNLYFCSILFIACSL